MSTVSNSVNSVKSYSAVLPPSPMVFLIATNNNTYDMKNTTRDGGNNTCLYIIKPYGWNARIEICRDCHDRRSCKISAICVNFPGKQHDISHNLRTTTRFTHTKYDFAPKLFKFYTLSFVTNLRTFWCPFYRPK